MIELLLNQALTDLVKTAVKDFSLEKSPRKVETKNDRRPGGLFVDSDPAVETETTERAGVTVYDGWLPSKDVSRPSDFPFVTVRPSAGAVENGCTTVTEEIVIGTFSRDEDGYHDAMNVAQRIATAISNLKFNVLAGKYEKADPMSWNMPFEQEKPFFMVVLTTTWRVYTTQFPFDD